MNVDIVQYVVYVVVYVVVYEYVVYEYVVYVSQDTSNSLWLYLQVYRGEKIIMPRRTKVDVTLQSHQVGSSRTKYSNMYSVWYIQIKMLRLCTTYTVLTIAVPIMERADILGKTLTSEWMWMYLLLSTIFRIFLMMMMMMMLALLLSAPHRRDIFSSKK
jgi:hypothetical protein